MVLHGKIAGKQKVNFYSTQRLFLTTLRFFLIPIKWVLCKIPLPDLDCFCCPKRQPRNHASELSGLFRASQGQISID
jgi:hypothetical protein